MEGWALVEGRLHGYRQKRGRDSPFRKVKLLSKVGRNGAIKARFEDDPDRGLEEHVRTRQIVVLWSERRAFLRDEARTKRLEAYAVDNRDSAIEEAVITVLASSGEPSASGGQGVVLMPESEIEWIMRRAHLEGRAADLHHLGFRDRHGEVHVPLEAGAIPARAFAAAEPTTVLMYVHDREEELRIRGNAPGQRYVHNVLRIYLPGFACARQWARAKQEVELLQQEVAHLRGLVSMAACDLKALGAEAKHRNLLRALDGG